MHKKTIETTISIYDGLSELPEKIQQLFKSAQEARDKAYAPYSGYKVGAAVQLVSGEIITGSNQENAAYPSGLCAERTALFYTGARFPDEIIESIAITAKSAGRTIDTPTAPCGSCRQAIAEYEFKQEQKIAIYFTGETGPVIKTESLADLLPLTFDRSFL